METEQVEAALKTLAEALTPELNAAVHQVLIGNNCAIMNLQDKIARALLKHNVLQRIGDYVLAPHTV